jgi:DNA-binding transcriptional MerR regulator
MKTIHEVSELAGISIRTLQYYDNIGLLHPSSYSDSGYRLYSDNDLEKLQQILLFRELEFPLKEIKDIINRPDFDRSKALEQQIQLLTLKKEHLENLITLARGIKTLGGYTLDFKAFDKTKLDEYAKEAKAAWGNTPEYKEFEEKDKNRTPKDNENMAALMMEIFKEFGRIKDQDPASDKAQALVKQLQDFITEHFYTCSNEILSSLGKMYSAGGDFTTNIDKAGGEGTAKFADEAIQIYCK